MAEAAYPLYPTAVVIPILAFPAWILCIPPMVWHFSQRNIAAGSLILWMSLLNFFNSINALIWPRDNITEWWNGNGLCDIEARVQVGAVVSLTTCAAVIARRLAKVMDTHNITVAPSRNSVMKEKILEVVWCWGFPIVMMATYYIVQPARYFIFGISGCVAAYDASWPSLLITWIWGPVTALVGAFYAGLLVFRLYRYRREFHRLIAARNTTKSRFMRLFLMAVIFITVFLPYQFYILYALASTIKDKYDWGIVHGPNWNSVIKVPAQGSVRMDKWGMIASGYVLFLLFGTGMDAHNTYKRMLCTLGLGKIFPSLYIMRESSNATPSSVTFAKGWTSTLSSKAKGLFSKDGSVTDTLPSSNRHASTVLGSPTTDTSGNLKRVSTNEPMLVRDSQNASIANHNQFLFSRILGRRNQQPPVLPIAAHGSVEQMTSSEKSPVESIPPGIHVHAWASDDAAAERGGSSHGVHVVHEVHQDHRNRGEEKQTDSSAWV